MNIRNFVPMIEVESVERSIAFYESLGFEVLNTFTPEGEDRLGWASLRAEGDGPQLMLSRGSAGRGSASSVLFYLYCDDVPAAHEELTAAGIACGEIATPFYNPRGEFEVRDPDGYVVMVTHT